MENPEKLTDAELDELYETITNGIETLFKQGEHGDSSQARILWYAFAMYMDERKHLAALTGAAKYAKSHPALVETELGLLTT